MKQYIVVEYISVITNSIWADLTSDRSIPVETPGVPHSAHHAPVPHHFHPEWVIGDGLVITSNNISVIVQEIVHHFNFLFSLDLQWSVARLIAIEEN